MPGAFSNNDFGDVPVIRIILEADDDNDHK